MPNLNIPAAATAEAAPTLTRWSAWAQTTRLVPAARAVGRMVALAAGVTAAYWALLFPGSAPGALSALAGAVGVQADALTGKGWPVVEWLTAHLGLVPGALLVTAPLPVLVGFLLLRRGWVTRLVEALAR